MKVGPKNGTLGTGPLASSVHQLTTIIPCHTRTNMNRGLMTETVQ